MSNTNSMQARMKRRAAAKTATTSSKARPRPAIDLPSPGSDPIEEAMIMAMNATAEDLPQLLTPDEVADRLGIGARTLERWRCIGEGPRFVKLSRSTVRYRPEDIARFVADRIKANTLQ